MVVVPAGFGETAGMFWATDQVPLRVGRDPSRMAEAAMLEGYLMEAAGKLIARRLQDTQLMRRLIAQQQDALNANDSLAPLTKVMVSQLFASLDHLADNLDQVATLDNAAGGEGSGPLTGDFQFVRLEPFDGIRRTKPQGPTIRSGWDLSFPQSILWGVMASAAGFAMSLVREQTRGTLLRMRTAPILPREVILGKGLACFLATVLVVALMLALGLALGMRPQSPGLLAISVIAVAFCFVGIMMAMSALGSTEEGVGGAGWAINMVMAMFGGAMMPLTFMPNFMKTLSNFSPVKWAIVALEGAIWRGDSATELLVPWCLLFLIGAIGLGAGLWFFRRRYALSP
jgi:ABC-2 type transport system permease protein